MRILQSTFFQVTYATVTHDQHALENVVVFEFHEHSHHEDVQDNGCYMMYHMVDCESVRPAIREGKAVMDAARNNFPNNADIKRYLKWVYDRI